MAIGVASLAMVGQVLSAFISRPKDKAAATAAATAASNQAIETRFAELETYVGREISGAYQLWREQRNETRRLSGSFPSLSTIEAMQRQVDEVTHQIDDLVKQLGGAHSRLDGLEGERDEERRTRGEIQRQLVEALTTLRFLHDGLKEIKEKLK